MGFKALTHQRVSFSPFLSSLSSQLPLLIPFLRCSFTCPSRRIFMSPPLHFLPSFEWVQPHFSYLGISLCFPFGSTTSVASFPVIPSLLSLSLSLSLSLIPPLVSLSHHFAYSHCPPMSFPHTVFQPLLHFPTFSHSLLTFSLSPFSHSPHTFSFTPSVCPS